MTNILTLSEQDIFPSHTPPATYSRFSKREAARAVLLGPGEEVYLMRVGRHNYHKLPGGGIETGEDAISGLMRELLEEVGCKAEVIAEVGTTIEYRDYIQQTQLSLCYLARRIGELGLNSLDEGEQADNMSIVTVPSIDEAIALLQGDRPDDITGKFIQRRDSAILAAAQTLLHQE